MTPTHTDTATPFQSFWMGGYEGADHINGLGVPLDMVHATGHLARLDEDHAAAAARGIRTVRESIGWRLAEPHPGRFNLGRAEQVARSANRHGLQVVWTLMHYGTPPDVSLFDDALIDRFAVFAARVAETIGPLSERPPVYNLVNEISFLAWAVVATNMMHPYRGDPADRHGNAGGDTAASGYAAKQRLVRAVLAGIAAVRAVDPRARFLHVEPVVHVIAPPGQPELAGLASQVSDYQWQAWDMIGGRADPWLGGDPGALDLIGVNYYHNGQWEAATERRLGWHERDPRRRPLALLLEDVWARYRTPLVIAETSHFGAGRAAWLHDVASEVARAQRAGVPVAGICLYPLIDRPDWSDAATWHHSGLWDVDESAPLPAPAAALGAASAAAAGLAASSGLAGSPATPLPRSLCGPYADALTLWQTRLGALGAKTAPPELPWVVVFSHLRWDFVRQRPQHLVLQLAKRHRVLFVEEPVKSEAAPHLARIAQGPNLDVLVPRTPVDAGGFDAAQMPLIKPLLDAWLREHGVVSPTVWFYTPMAWPLAERWQPRAVVYDCMDELAAFDGAPPALPALEAALLARADLVLTRGPSLFQARRGRSRHVHCLPSSVDAAHFAPSNLRPGSFEARAAERLQGALPRPRLGFCGVIDERLDRALLRALAAVRPAWQIVMVGPVVKIDPATLPQAPNLHWLGLQPYERLPHLIGGWDVCLIPFAINAATRFISPTKTLEYMAAEKSVVSTAVPDVVALYGDVVRIARSQADFIAACDAALTEAAWQRAPRQNAMLATVARSSWARTAEVIEGLLASLDTNIHAGHAVPVAP